MRGATRIVESRLGLATGTDKVDYRVVWARIGMYVCTVSRQAEGGSGFGLGSCSMSLV